MKPQIIKWAPILVTAGVLAVVCLIQTLRVWWPEGDFMQPVKWITYDWRVRLATRYPFPCATNLAAVFIDESSLETLAKGGDLFSEKIKPPFPRRVYGAVVRELTAQGAKVVGIDVLFDLRRTDLAGQMMMPLSEARKMGFTEGELAEEEIFPRFPYTLEEPGKPAQEVPGVLVQSDSFFALQLRQGSNVVLAAETTEGVIPDDLFRTNTWAVGDITVDKDSDGKLRRLYAYKDYRIWHPAIRNAVTTEGYKLSQATVKPDRISFPKEQGSPLVLQLDAQGCFNPGDLPGPSTPGRPGGRERPFQTQRYWHMGILLAARELNLNLTNTIVDVKRKRLILRGAGGMERIIPVDSQGRFLIDWSLTWEDPRLFYVNLETVLALDKLRHSPRPSDHAKVLEGLREVGKNWAGDYPYRHKLVVIGSKLTGSNMADVGPTPLSKQTYFVSAHWNVANSVITGRFVRPASYLAELLLILLLGGAAAWPTWRLHELWASLLVVLLAGLYVAAGAWLYIGYRYWLPVTLPLLGLVLTHVGMVTYRVVFEQHERRRVKSVFAKLVSPEVVNELLQTEQLSLGGGRRRVTAFFADVRGFTEMTDISQAMAEDYVREHQLSGPAAVRVYDEQARDVLATVNLYLGTIADIIKKHGGTLDKYIGDCVMAFWGAPVPNDQHALCCVRAAIEAQRAIDSLNQERLAENQRRAQENPDRTAAGQLILPMQSLLSVGTGINTGLVTVGLMGSDATILNYTIFGREVNLASRLEGVSGRGRIIISESTFGDLQRDDPALAARCQEQPPVTVKGIRKAVKIFEVPWKTVSQTEPAPAGGDIQGGFMQDSSSASH